ncbi:MAG: hypothetical protein K2Y01_10715 [Rhabdochlamydiaceae bacterium]|nr:hypothetical protein [Rhabdochlamydiaceae bacterium]
MKKGRALLFLLLLSCGCQKYYLTLYQEKVDETSLASTYVGTPDPRQKDPPIGQKLILEWQIPKELIAEHPSLHLQVIYRNYAEAQFVYPISYKSGYIVYSLVGEEYKKTGGLLSYRAQIQNQDGVVFRSWQHQLWVQLLHLEEPVHEQPEEEEVPQELETEEEQSATFFPPN